VKHTGWVLAGLAGLCVVAGVAWSGASAPQYLPERSPAEASVAPAPAPAPPWSPTVLDEAAGELPQLHSLLASRRGAVIFEEYYNGRTASRSANIKSASKSIVSALVGIALDRGLIPGVDTRIVTYFPELAQDPDPRKQEITIAHLLEMRSGLDGTSGGNYGAWVTSRNWVQHALARPMIEPPDQEMEYSTGNTHLLSAILTKATGKSTWQFANEVLATPLGFTLARWPRDPQGIYFGGNDMLMTPRQMLAFGELYLDKGRVGDTQVVPEAWVERSCEGRARNRRPGGRFGFGRGGFDPMRDRKYGYLWWVHEMQGYETCFAWGYGGQYIFVVPELDLVAVATSSPDVGEGRRGHRRTLLELVSDLIVAPMAGDGVPTSRSPAASPAPPGR
jgi:CubicO group peptidase (beta-lactamase class C family)